MVRTKASAGCSSAAIRVSAAKAPRKSLGSSAARSSFDHGSPAGKKDKSTGNPVCVRQTPDWQKPIGRFFTKIEKTDKVAISMEEKSPEKESPSVSHDDKENKNPKDETIKSTSDISANEGPSSSGLNSKKKKKRILTIADSDSDEEMVTADPMPSSSKVKDSGPSCSTDKDSTSLCSKVNGCVVKMDEEITTES